MNIKRTFKYNFKCYEMILDNLISGEVICNALTVTSGLVLFFIKSKYTFFALDVRPDCLMSKK